jgi:ABC-type bacteriocin/lantibiotic exporter with double-glycine peptidase domain
LSTSTSGRRSQGGTKTLQRLWQELGRDRPKVVLVVAMTVVQGVCTWAPTLALQALLDAIPSRDLALVHAMAATLVCLAICWNLLSWWHRALTARVGYGFDLHPAPALTLS